VVDERTLLCEDCGYDLSGLALDADCSECGRPVRASHPASRPGSPWQISPGLSGWLSTNLAVVRSPRALMARLRIEWAGATKLAIANCLLAGALLVAPWVGTLAGDPARASRADGGLFHLFTLSWVFAAQAVAVGLGLLILTFGEYLGIRFIASRRQWRLIRPAAWQVCCHATIGWCFAAIGPAAGLGLVYLMRDVLKLPLGRLIDLRPWVPGLGFTSLGQVLTLLLPAACFIAGLFVYELLVHLGVRANRYAARL
jgi:hypothetical protein